jgi:HEAT repeat protein
MTLASLLSTEADVRIGALDDLSPELGGADYAVREVLLGDEDATVRAAAATWLERARATSCGAALVDALYDTHPSVRLAACRALAKIASREALPVLRRLAIEEPIWWVRRGAVLAVARIERHQAIPLLREVLDDPFWRVRHAAVRVLVALGQASEDLARVITTDAFEGSERAQGALQYLQRRLGRAGTATELAGPIVVPQPDGLVADPDPAVITARLEHGRAATAAELALYLGDPHAALRAVASRRLRRAPNVRALLAASLWLEEPRIPHATASVIALLDAVGGAAVEELIDVVLAKPDARPGVAAWALSFISLNARWDRLDAVVQAMDAEEPIVRRAATSALGRFLASGIASGEPFERLVVALEDRDEDVHRLAAHGLLHAGSSAGWEALLSLRFADEPVLVRRLIVVAARETRDVATLRSASVDVDPETRAWALAALHSAGLLDVSEIAAARASADPWLRGAVLDATNALTTLREDVDTTLRRRAFVCATRSGLVLEAARIACKDEDPWLRAHAAERLARSTGDDDLVHLLRLSRDADVGVRAAAADVVELSRDLSERLSRVRDVGDVIVRDAADTWLGHRARALMSEVLERPMSSGASHPARTPAPPREPASARPLGHTGLTISPLVLSGANEPSVASLFGALEAGCNAFFWEPRYRNLTAFLKSAADRGQRPLVVCGTYHATERAIRDDVHRTLRRLRRDRLDVFLVFWTRSPARLEGEVARALERLRRDGLIGAAGFSTHDRALAESVIGSSPWDVVMVRHSAAHPGAEERLFRRAEERGVGVLGFSATSYGRLLRRAPGSPIAPPTAAECYRYTLSQPGVGACVSAPRGGRELIENLEVLVRPTLDAARLEELRIHGRRVREESLDFGRHIRRFPALPDDIDDDLDAADDLRSHNEPSALTEIDVETDAFV